jgi:hypothetical protein
MKHLNSRQSGQILWIAMIILSAAPFIRIHDTLDACA